MNLYEIAYFTFLTSLYCAYSLTEVNSKMVPKDSNIQSLKWYHKQNNTVNKLDETNFTDIVTTRDEGSHKFYNRVKRQSSAGANKFEDASKTSQMKVIRLLLQMVKNMFSTSYVGGAGPFHKDVPKPVVYLFKDNIINYFMPDVGEQHKKKSH